MNFIGPRTKLLCNQGFQPLSFPAAVFMLVFILAGVCRAEAQDTLKTVTLHVKSEPLVKVFAAIENQTGYVFFYDAALLKKSNPVSCNFKNEEIRTVLKKILQDQGLTYLIENKTITISREIVIATVSPTLAPSSVIISVQDSWIHGRVINKKGGYLPNVTISNTIKGTSQKTYAVSDINGSFNIQGQKGDILKFYSVGYKTADVKYAGEPMLKVSMQENIVDLSDISVKDVDPFKKRIPWTDTIDMTHRTHLNLGELLQGSIPGLTLQNSNENQQTLTSVSSGGNKLSVNTIHQYYQYFANNGFFSGSYNDFLEEQVREGSTLNYSNSTSNNGLVPQLRGASGFNGNTSGMLIVIDGFPQNGFPSDYPMTNVQSVKVIKDPEELTKWGPAAAGGAIIITTKQAAAGKLQLSYNSNFYYSAAPKFNRNKLRLASSADMLEYMKAASDSGFVLYPNSSIEPIPLQLNYPQLLLFDLQQGMLSQAAFDTKWDSLSNINNEGQIRLLEQNIFNQNQSLRLSGGSKAYRFTATGSYTTSRTSALHNYNHTASLILDNNFSLLKNKLQAEWYINISGSKTNAGYAFDPTNSALQPYQLLLGPKGNYIYDYSALNPDANDIMMKYGYENYGVNLLEDARANSNITNTFYAQSRLNINFDLSPDLKWTSSLQYNMTNANTEDLQRAESSVARQMVDNYGSPIIGNNGDVTGIDFYVPAGGIFTYSSSRNKNWNLRSALMFNKNFGKHALSVTLGGGSSSNIYRMPSYATVYGYNTQTGKGQAVQLPSSESTASVSNFYSLPGINYALSLGAYPYTLFTPNAGDTTIARGLNWNGRLQYSFDSIFTLQANYNAELSPNYGYDPPYTNLAYYSAAATLRLDKLFSLRFPKYMSSLSISAGVDGTKIPNLPTQITASRNLQSDWNNYGIWINSYSIPQQSGQNINDIYEKVTLGLADNHLLIGVGYHTSLIDSLIKADSSDEKRKHFLSADATIKLRKNLLYLKLAYLHSPEGHPQTNLMLGYDIANETYFYSHIISTLIADFTLKNISPYQGMLLMANTNAPLDGGSYSMAINSNFGLLPSAIKNMEVHASMGFLKDRYLLDLRYYRKVTSGLNNNLPIPTDPSTGLSTQVSYSSIINKGIELFLNIKAVRQRKFAYTITLNGSYNKNIVQSVPVTNFSEATSYLAAYRNGYSVDNLWSYKWAGLDNKGNPQIYNATGQKTVNPDSATLASSLIYSGVTRAPYTGGLIQEWSFGNFFARATLLLNLGYVMREYIPSPSGLLDNSILIGKRWRKPGDENSTDVPSMANIAASSTRTFITQNSTNSILPADNIRLQEVQIGWEAPKKMLQHFFIKNLTISLQAQNLALWTKNKLDVDPETVSNTGGIGLTQSPRQYSLSMNMDF